MTAPNNSSPPTRVLVFVGFTLVLVLGMPAFMYYATEPAGRADFLDRLVNLVPTAVGAFWALLAYLKGRDTEKTQQEIVTQVTEVKEQVNGRMSQLIERNDREDAKP